MTDNKKPSLLASFTAMKAKPTVTPTPSSVSATTPTSPLAKGMSLLGNHKDTKIVPAAAATPAPAPATKPSLLAGVQAAAQKQAEVEKKAEVIFKELPIDFQELLDSFDSYMAASAGIDTLTLDTPRAYVKRIMTDLKEHPEFDGLFMDRDVRNVIRLIRALKESALVTIDDKKVKAERKASNAKAKVNRFGNIDNIVLDLSGVSEMGIEDL